MEVCHPKTHRLNQSGFAFVACLYLTTLLVTIGLAAGQLVHLLQKQKKEQHRCLVEGLKLQKKLGQELRRLLKLNPKATYLRYKKNTLVVMRNAVLIMAAAAGPAAPPLIARAVRLHQQIVRVKRRQQKLGLKQKAIFAKAQFHILRFKTKMGLVKKRFKYPLKGLAVKGYPAKSVAPTYKLKSNFAEAQRVVARWTDSIPYLGWFSRSTTRGFKNHCGVTLKRKGFSWKSKIKMDKSSLSSQFLSAF